MLVTMLRWLTVFIAAVLCDADGNCWVTLALLSQSKDDPAKLQSFANMVLSTGKAFPFDAGKYIMCMNTVGAKYHMMTVNANFSGYAHDTQFGLCLPDVCTAADAESFANAKLPDNWPVSPLFPTTMWNTVVRGAFVPQLMLPGLQVKCTESGPCSTSGDDMRSPGIGTWIATAVVGLMTLLIIVSTLVHVQARSRPVTTPAEGAEGGEALLRGEAPRPKPGLEKNLLFSAFSLIGPNGTWDKLWAIPSYKNTDCLNGARVLSMMWVVIGHTFLMAEGVVGYTNPEDISLSPLNDQTAETNWIYMFLFNAQLSVDTFFWMGGFLFSFLTMQELKKTNGKFKYVPALILRYLRLTPSLALVMLVYYQIWPFLASGPFAPKFQDSIFRRCDISWWSELTYTLNFIPFDSDNVCMGWTWYLGDDMIFFIVGIFLVPLYYFQKTIGWIVTAVLTLASFGITGYLIYQHHLSPAALDDKERNAYFLWAYSKPYTRIPVYFVGVAAGWILLSIEARRKERAEREGREAGRWVSPTVATLLWLFAIGVTTAIVILPFWDQGNFKDDWNDTASFLYLTFARPIWGVCWTLLAYLCYYGQAPITNGLLSHWFWTPFARLTYGAYLCHPLVIKLSGGNAVQFYTFSPMDLFYRFAGNFILAYFGSFLQWCYIERPVMTFTTAMMKGKGGSKGAKQISEKQQTAESTNKPLAGK